jgi:hypothetical protein
MTAARLADEWTTCALCGARYALAEGRACRPGCPLGRGCDLLRCPFCGYETPAPTPLTRWLDRWIRGKGAGGVSC